MTQKLCRDEHFLLPLHLKMLAHLSIWLDLMFKKSISDIFSVSYSMQAVFIIWKCYVTPFISTHSCFSCSLFDMYFLLAYHLVLFAWVLRNPHWIPFCLFSPPSWLPSPPFSPTHQQAASQSKAQKKLQPLTQVPILQEQGEYCARVGGVRTWVPAMWLMGM